MDKCILPSDGVFHSLDIGIDVVNVQHEIDVTLSSCDRSHSSTNVDDVST